MRRLWIPLMVMLLASTANADWLRFRGPNGSGVSDENVATPNKWTPDTVKWKLPLLGPGSSCPIVVGDKIFVTCWSGYGTENGSNNQEDLRRHLVCINKATGKEIWSKAVKAVLPEDNYGGMFAEHGYASHTPVSDGEHVFAFFGKSGVVAFDMEGNQLWQTSVGTESGAKNWGSASSPILHKNLVIVPATAESESIVALDKATGEKVWDAPAAGFNSTWGSPLLTTVDGRTDVVIAIPYEIWGLNADTGKLAWYADAVPTSSLCSSVVADENGIVYVVESGRDGGGGVAIRAGGSKDVTNSHKVWSGRQASRIATPVVFDGRLYTVSNKVLTCFDAATGDELFKGRLRSAGRSEPAAAEEGGARGRGRGGRGGRGGGGQDYGSPVLADGKLYFTSRAGETFVLKVGDKFEQISANKVTNDREDFSATPAISNGELFIRSDKHLYCVAGPAK